MDKLKQEFPAKEDAIITLCIKETSLLRIICCLNERQNFISEVLRRVPASEYKYYLDRLSSLVEDRKLTKMNMRELRSGIQVPVK